MANDENSLESTNGISCKRRKGSNEFNKKDDAESLIQIDLTNYQKERRWNIIYTTALYYSFISLGLCNSIFNPTMIELSKICGTNLKSISTIFPVHAVGSVFGTLSVSILTKYINRHILVSSGLLLKSVTVLLVPQWRSVQSLCINGFFNGYFTAAIDVMINVWVNEIWSQSSRQKRLELRGEASSKAGDPTAKPVKNVRDESINIGNVLMQGLHFFYGVGTILGPLLAEPFLVNPFINSSGFFQNNLVIPYIICSASSIVACVILFSLYSISPYQQLNIRQSSQAELSVNGDLQRENNSAKNFSLLRNLVFIMAGIFLMVFDFSEGAYFQFSSSFATETKLNISEAKAAILAASMATSYTIARGLSIFIAIKLTPGTMIFLDIFIVLGGNTLVFFFSDTSLPLFTSGLVLLGAGFASAYPSFFPFLEYHNFVVTDFAGALLVFGAQITQVVGPFVVGFYMDTVPMILVYSTFFSMALSAIFFISTYLLIRVVKTRSQPSN